VYYEIELYRISQRMQLKEAAMDAFLCHVVAVVVEFGTVFEVFFVNLLVFTHVVDSLISIVRVVLLDSQELI